jgi:hypothetical protein
MIRYRVSPSSNDVAAKLSGNKRVSGDHTTPKQMYYIRENSNYGMDDNYRFF